MFQPVFENLRKATESTIHLQQEMFKQWTSLLPGLPPAPPTGAEQAQRLQKKWAEVAGELYKKQCESLELQFKTGLRNLEDSFRLAKTTNPEELRAQTMELWQKSIDCLRQTCEAQLRDFQTAAAKWTEFMMKGAAGYWAAT